jgi:hypothetical protein
MRQGPAPFNLAVPEYAFLTDTKVKTGWRQPFGGFFANSRLNVHQRSMT